MEEEIGEEGHGRSGTHELELYGSAEAGRAGVLVVRKAVSDASGEGEVGLGLVRDVGHSEDWVAVWGGDGRAMGVGERLERARSSPYALTAANGEEGYSAIS